MKRNHLIGVAVLLGCMFIGGAAQACPLGRLVRKAWRTGTAPVRWVVNR